MRNLLTNNVMCNITTLTGANVTISTMWSTVWGSRTLNESSIWVLYFQSCSMDGVPNIPHHLCVDPGSPGKMCGNPEWHYQWNEMCNPIITLLCPIHTLQNMARYLNAKNYIKLTTPLAKQSIWQTWKVSFQRNTSMNGHTLYDSFMLNRTLSLCRIFRSCFNLV